MLTSPLSFKTFSTLGDRVLRVFTTPACAWQEVQKGRPVKVSRLQSICFHPNHIYFHTPAADRSPLAREAESRCISTLADLSLARPLRYSSSPLAMRAWGNFVASAAMWETCSEKNTESNYPSLYPSYLPPFSSSCAINWPPSKSASPLLGPPYVSSHTCSCSAKVA